MLRRRLKLFSIILNLTMILVFILNFKTISFNASLRENDIQKLNLIREEFVINNRQDSNKEYKDYKSKQVVKRHKSKWKSLGIFLCTSYCSCPYCCGEYSDGITSTGTHAIEGRTIAVDPTVIPYGSKVLINGNIYIAEDCGSAIKGNHIDIFYNSHEKALNVGTNYMDVKILRKE